MILRLTKGGFHHRNFAKYICPHCGRAFDAVRKIGKRTFCPYCKGPLIMPKEKKPKAKPVIVRQP